MDLVSDFWLFWFVLAFYLIIPGLLMLIEWVGSHWRPRSKMKMLIIIVSLLSGATSAFLFGFSVIYKFVLGL